MLLKEFRYVGRLTELDQHLVAEPEIVTVLDTYRQYIDGLAVL